MTQNNFKNNLHKKKSLTVDETKPTGIEDFLN